MLCGRLFPKLSLLSETSGSRVAEVIDGIDQLPEATNVKCREDWRDSRSRIVI